MIKHFLKTLGLGLVLAGVHLFARAPAGVNRASLAGFGIGAAGLLFFAGSEWGRGRRGHLFKLVSGACFAILGIASLFLMIFTLLDSWGWQYLAAGAATGAGALIGVFRSLGGQAGDLALDLAPQLGFEEIAEDSDYAAQGTVNGVKVAYNLFAAHSRNDEPWYSLDIACAVPNQAGLRLCAYTGARDLKPLPEKLAAPPEFWEEFKVHCSPADADLKRFSELRRSEDSLFVGESGFHFLELEGGLLKAGFRVKDKMDAAILKRLLEAVTGAAGIFS